MKLLPPTLLGLFAGALIVCASPPASEMKPSSTVIVRLLDSNGNPTPPTEVPRVVKSDEEWKKQLGEENYRILRAKGTEPAFCGALFDHHQDGLYFCAGCDLPLFSSNAKFDSGTGWPSFFKPFAKENLVEITDRSHGMERTEILCTRCEGHLGHVFNDGAAALGIAILHEFGLFDFPSFRRIQIGRMPGHRKKSFPQFPLPC